MQRPPERPPATSEAPKSYRPLVKDFSDDCGFDLSKVKIEKGAKVYETTQQLIIPPSFQQRRAHLQKSTISLTPGKF